MKKNLKVFVCVRDVGSQIIKIIHQEHLALMAKPVFETCSLIYKNCAVAVDSNVRVYKNIINQLF